MDRREFLQHSVLSITTGMVIGCRVRGSKLAGDGAVTEYALGPWLHIGTDDTYLALQESTAEPDSRWVPYAGKPGLNHLGYEVEDAEAVRARLQAAGYQDSTVPNSHPHRKRVYFYDPEGNDWEFIQYLSDDPAERHDYSLANG